VPSLVAKTLGQVWLRLFSAVSHALKASSVAFLHTGARFLAQASTYRLIASPNATLSTRKALQVAQVHETNAAFIAHGAGAHSAPIEVRSVILKSRQEFQLIILNIKIITINKIKINL